MLFLFFQPQLTTCNTDDVALVQHLFHFVWVINIINRYSMFQETDCT
ncbi:hypothetical protein BIFLAC_05637 [Bifidobacterium animalis subsp. lactis HN019]|nr:hypothetical protein BIFLAC_05637 [Bifidobacterium animalis subsp. lactis HN019]